MCQELAPPTSQMLLLPMFLSIPKNLMKYLESGDDPLSGELLTKWRNILLQLCCLKSIQVPRYYFGGNRCATRQLYGFCDASNRTFADVIYLQSVYDDNCVKTVLTASKTRVAPMKRRDWICKKGLIRTIINI